MYKIGKKLGGEKGYVWYLIPIYNLALLMENSNVNLLWLITLFIPFVNIIVIGYIWGQISKNLGKNPWIWGIFCLFLPFLAIPILAFGSSRKV